MRGVPTQFSFEAIGTKWKVSIWRAVSRETQRALKNAIFDRIEQYDHAYSRFRKDSLVTQLSTGAISVEMPEDITLLFSIYKTLFSLSNGLFTPCIGQTLSDLGYDADYSLKSSNAEIPPSFNEVTLKDQTISTSQQVLLDFGAGGKGYLIDIISRIIEQYGIEEYTVDGSGDIVHRASSPLKVGLEHPEVQSKVLGGIAINDQSICSSSGNRRKWESYHHIINPQTLLSPVNILSTWVIAKNGLTADALSTCLFLVEPEMLADDFEFEYLILFSDFSYKKSPSFSAKMFYC